MSRDASSRAARERNRGTVRLRICGDPRRPPLPGPCQPALAMAKREQGPPGSKVPGQPRVLAPNPPRAPETSLCSAHAAPRPRREQSPPQPGQGLQLPPPAPADGRLHSLTLADELELFLLAPQVPPGDAWEHRACSRPQRRSSLSAALPALRPHALLAPAGLSPGPRRIPTPEGTAARGRWQPRGQAGLHGPWPGSRCLPGQQPGLGPGCGGAGRGPGLVAHP